MRLIDADKLNSDKEKLAADEKRVGDEQLEK